MAGVGRSGEIFSSRVAEILEFGKSIRFQLNLQNAHSEARIK
jgi:hypothetical protein